MRLICPACGAIASAEAWQNETTVRQFLGVLEKLPGVVRVAWPRALRIISDLAALVEPGTVHWDGGEERPAPPRLWVEALDATLARRPKALENHNYLRKVAWEMARDLAVSAERHKDHEAAHRAHITDDEAQPMTDDERRAWARQLTDMMGKMGQ